METSTGLAGIVLGPLTTAWSMPDACTVYVPACATCTKAYRGQQCSGKVAGSDGADCWPPVTVRETPKPPFFGWGFYSPGLACPTGYTTACTAEYGGRAGWDIQFTLVPGETAVGCCPQDFSCTNRGGGNVCVAVASVGTQMIVETGVCPGPGLAITGIAQATFPDIITTTITGAVQTATREMILLAPMFQLNYKASDLASASSSATTASATGTNQDPDPDANTSGSDASSAASANNQGGLSTGAIAGIGVGAALGGILFAAAAGWLWWKRRKRVRTTRQGSSVASTAPETSHEVDSSRGAWQAHKPEPLYYHSSQNAGRGNVPIELESQPPAVELWTAGSTPSRGRFS
ncbi:hypothetical protein C8A00DRAFT_15763 [Chaetomidium leptoderma]|uniref:Uncharacterized protein n=1 Tax=Chaetomidium leptoderma TaxID=669021 RepID=A0AAN6VKI1_9PEZI|nr:hypothetical protein C8A00DRAFT_15763 [Chaetomidium leptoderma]